jgi:hypothetical protein
MQSKQIENIVADEVNRRTYVVLAPRVLSDGEIYRAIRREILKRGGAVPNAGETLTINLTPGDPARTPPPDFPGRENPSPLLVADQGASWPQPMPGPAPARSLPGEST